MSAPTTPLIAPKIAASTTMPSRRRAHWRAAAAGAITSATIRITPTICSPITTATAMSTLSANSMATTGRPRLRAKSASKVVTLSSFQPKTTTRSESAPTTARTARSRGTSAAA